MDQTDLMRFVLRIFVNEVGLINKIELYLTEIVCWYFTLYFPCLSNDQMMLSDFFLSIVIIYQLQSFSLLPFASFRWSWDRLDLCQFIVFSFLFFSSWSFFIFFCIILLLFSPLLDRSPFMKFDPDRFSFHVLMEIEWIWILYFSTSNIRKEHDMTLNTLYAR